MIVPSCGAHCATVASTSAGRSIVVAAPLAAGTEPTARSTGLTAGAARREHVKPSAITLSAKDPTYGYGLQVGDTLEFRAVVRDPNRARAWGKVSFRADNRYDQCRPVQLRNSDVAVCYMTFYTPGHVSMTAAYAGADHSSARVTLHVNIVPNTQY